MTMNESAENYLETILVLSHSLPVVRSVDIANEMGFKKSSVSVAMRRLAWIKKSLHRMHARWNMSSVKKVLTQLNATSVRMWRSFFIFSFSSKIPDNIS